MKELPFEFIDSIVKKIKAHMNKCFILICIITIFSCTFKKEWMIFSHITLVTTLGIVQPHFAPMLAFKGTMNLHTQLPILFLKTRNYFTGLHTHLIQSQVVIHTLTLSGTHSRDYPRLSRILSIGPLGLQSLESTGIQSFHLLGSWINSITLHSEKRKLQGS